MPFAAKTASASMKGCFHSMTNVRGSGAVARSIRRRPELRSSGRSGSWAMVTLNSRSSELSGVPSCHAAPSRIFQVVSIRPSGKTFHSPLAVLGTASASTGASAFRLSSWVSPAFASCSTSVMPGRVPAPLRTMRVTSALSSVWIPTTIRLGPVLAAGAGAPSAVAGARLGAQPRTSSTISNGIATRAHRRIRPSFSRSGASELPLSSLPVVGEG
jgi:hypothetical protein